MTRGAKVAQSWEQLEGEQLKLYAQELSELYYKEQELRRAVEDKNRALEERNKELTALNTMLQNNLGIRLRSESALWLCVSGIRKIVEEASDLLRQAEGVASPDRGEKTGAATD